ncbi:hypothetical protein [Photobacterium lucens]|uniref:hypothetical protein n=1 Tax=Photobacterium lucens TaxID=2562949 RepID=UPI00136AEDD5|nr:hypothetical protein [Photobacterium lucens]MBP2699924.1 hypothetical protein [Vibrio parahaemolyticus]MZG58569.1 hypothetical protein [Photobacterium lucens]MZG82748.1 hypothetical protein [Photobacterium lucens]
MATQTLLKCYSYEKLDFFPEKHLLLWRDDTRTLLTREESRLLEILCLFAGEVINADSLYRKTFTSLDAFEETSDHSYDINLLMVSLTGKLQCNGEMAIPIHVVPHFGFRVPLPTKTSRKQSVVLNPSSPKISPPPNTHTYEYSWFKTIVTDFIWLKVSILLSLAAVIGLLLWNS